MVPVNNKWIDEFKRMKLKRDCHAILTMSQQHRRSDANLSHRMVWATQQLKSLPITSLVEDIQKEAQRASLGQMGFNQNFSLPVVVDAPKAKGGLSNRASHNRTGDKRDLTFPSPHVCFIFYCSSITPYFSKSVNRL